MKHIFQSPLQWLVAIAAWFAMSATAVADDKVVTFDLTDPASYGQMTVGGFLGYTDGYEISPSYPLGLQGVQIWGDGNGVSEVRSQEGYLRFSGQVGVTVASADADYLISSIRFISASTSTSAPAFFSDYKFGGSIGEAEGGYCVDYQPAAPVASVTFNQFMGGSNIKKVIVNLLGLGTAEPVDYTVDFRGDVPEGCSASFGGQTFTADATFSVSRVLKEDDLRITTTDDYWADVTYDADSRVWTVEFKHYYSYRVVIDAPAEVINSALEYDGGYKFHGYQFKTRTYIDESEFSANMWGVSEEYEGKVSVTGSDYNYTITVSYVLKPIVAYYIVFPEGTPYDTRVRIEDKEYAANGTFTTAFTVRASDFLVFAPYGYWAEDPEKCYDPASRTFTVRVDEYYHYTVKVSGSTEGGVVFGGYHYGNGQRVDTRSSLAKDDFDLQLLAGRDVDCTIQGQDHDYTIQVVYTDLPAFYVSTLATDTDGYCYNTFSYDKPVSFAAGFTPCIVKGVDADGNLQIEELEGHADGVCLRKELNTAMIADAYHTGDAGDNVIVNTEDPLSPILTSTAVFYNYAYQICMSVSSADVVFHAPAGYLITAIEPYYDGEPCYCIEWPDGQVNGNYEGPAAAEVSARFYNADQHPWWYCNSILITLMKKAAPIVPAGTGILVKSSEPMLSTDYHLNVDYNIHDAHAEMADVSGNLLVAGDGTTWQEAGKSYYAFSTDSDQLAGSAGFYWTEEGGTSIVTSVHSAYLVLDAAAATDHCYLIGTTGSVPTAIDSVVAPESAAPIYNLQGQRVTTPAKGGIYVKQGKKFVK